MTRRAPPTQTCHAAGCAAKVHRAQLMCRAHWYALPQPLRAEINAAWGEGRFRDWSALCLEARRFLAAPPTAPVTAERAYDLTARQLGERA